MQTNITTITNDRMTAFCETLAVQARAAIFDRQEKLLETWHEAMNEATENEEDLPPLKFSLACSVDLAKNRIETKLRFSAVYSAIESEELPDPNQPELDGLESAKGKRKGGKA